MQLALKIDVDTLRGTREGMPQLLALLRRHLAQGTFLFSLGPDHTGRAIKRVFRPGFLGKVSRTSVVEHYGLKTLMYGTLLPGPDIGKRCGDVMRQVRDSGFEVGIHCYDHILWQDCVAGKGEPWTRRQLMLAHERFREIFCEPARTHGAAGWQINAHALRLERELGYQYCSDTRGSGPFIPCWDGEAAGCPQLPTTLPTLDELIGVDGLTPSSVAGHLLKLTRRPPACGHVFTLHAELEGMKLGAVLEQLIRGWRAQGYRMVSLGQPFATLKVEALPAHQVVMGEIAGRTGVLALQGPPAAAAAQPTPPSGTYSSRRR